MFHDMVRSAAVRPDADAVSRETADRQDHQLTASLAASGMSLMKRTL